MPIDLHYTPGSSPSRMVLLTASTLDLPLNLVHVNLGARENHNPDFLKLNHQHTIPVLVDDKLVLTESRAICRYLVNKYGKGKEGSQLYPENDVVARALIDEKLDFDIGTLYSRYADYFYPQLFGAVPPKPYQLNRLKEALGFLNTSLEGHTYAATSYITLADFSLVATISTIEATGISISDYKNIIRWYDLVKKTAKNYEKANAEGARVFGRIASHIIKMKSEL